MSSRRAIIFTLLLMLGVVTSCLSYLALQSWGEDLANKINLSNRQKATTHELLFHLARMKMPGTSTDKIFMEELQLVKSKWVNSQKALVNGSELFQVSPEKSTEAEAIVRELSPIYVHVNDQLSALLNARHGSEDSSQETISGLSQYASLVNDLTLQWVKEQEARTSTARMLLLILSAAILILGFLGYFVFIRPYVRHSVASASESKAMESVISRERNHRIRIMTDLSHQLRTPLSAILGNAELMQRWELDAKQRESVRALIGSVSNMMHVLDEVMDETAIEKGELEVHKLKFNFHECVEQVTEMLRPLTVNHHVSLTSFVSSRVPLWIVQDERRFRQVLLSVASDVIRHSEGRKININVDFLNEAEGLMQLKVTINGVDKELSDIYKSMRDEQSSGVLSRDLALRLVHELGGRIWTEESTNGMVLCMTMIAEEVRTNASENTRDLNGIKALIIEQDKNILKVLIRQLGTWGIQSTPFNSLELVEEVLGNLQKFDICIIDVDPGGGESLLLAEKLARQTEGRLPIIALTSTADAVVDSRSSLMSAYLTKPVKQVRLFETITGLLKIDDSLVLSQSATGRSNAQIDQYALNVIIAHDNELHRAVAARTLNLLGHRFENAFSMEELREKMSEKHFDLVLVDHDERQWKGFRLGQSQKNKNNKDSTVVIGVTDESNADLPSGYDDLLKGGFTGEKLEEKIRNWFEFE